MILGIRYMYELGVTQDITLCKGRRLNGQVPPPPLGALLLTNHQN